MFPVCGIMEKDVANRFDTYTRTHAHAFVNYSSLTNWLCTDDDWSSGLVCLGLTSSPCTHTSIFRARTHTHTQTHTVFNLPVRSQSRDARNIRENMTGRHRQLTVRNLSVNQCAKVDTMTDGDGRSPEKLDRKTTMVATKLLCFLPNTFYGVQDCKIAIIITMYCNRDGVQFFFFFIH